MTYMLIETLVVTRSTKGYSPPVGLLVFDIPLFLAWAQRYACIPPDSGFRPAPPQMLQQCVVWAFPSASMFVRGGWSVSSRRYPDRKFRMRGQFGGGEYRTAVIDLEELPACEKTAKPLTVIPRANDQGNPEFPGIAKRYMHSHRGTIRAWLGRGIMNNAAIPSDSHQRRKQSDLQSLDLSGRFPWDRE